MSDAAAAGEDMWLRTRTGWHLVFAALAVVTAALITMDASVPAGRRTAVLALLVVLGAWYVATAAKVLCTDRLSRLGLAYVAGAVPIMVAMYAVTPVSSVLLFGLYPQIWALLPTRQAVAATVCTTVGLGAVVVIGNGLSSGVIAVALIGAAVSLLVALLLGLWITRIIEQSQDRAALVAELEAARAELATVSHNAGVLAERERLARDLHDTLAQGFTSVLILLQAAEASLHRDVDSCAAHLALAAQTTRENLAEIRALVAALTPAALEDAPLPAALQRLTDRLGRELGITTTLVAHGHRGLPPRHEVVLLRATQEALANVRKHAGADRVDVELSYHDDRVTLRVHDDGRGFDPLARPGGYGLTGLRDRVRSIGGELTIEAAPGAGAAVAVCLPVGELA